LIHCDLKSKNIFITKDFLVKIGDFGTIKQKSEYKKIPNISTKMFQAPEFYLNLREKFTFQNIEKIDIYSIGCICYNFFFNDNYIDSKDFEDNYKDLIFYEKIYEKKILSEKFPKEISKEFSDFLKNTLNPHIDTRYNIQETLQSKWIYRNENFKYFTEIHDNDSIKFLLELQKIDFCEFLKSRLIMNIFQNENHQFQENEQCEFEDV